ncbi:uncharacterized protein LOC119840688 isoform X1 [Zerene cesonia]|uniref:uncharacterized protein LOC119840688 isoform X1 n=1 Tax=Zerene cesonia TaxID=33412 RepID=UPI0018E57EE0|nr:uncharacterized protein LOC119840688 isoform X1 [Zerene cesonia]
MRWFSICCVLLFAIASTSADWSWNEDKSDKHTENEPKSSDLLEGEEMANAEDKKSNNDGSVLDDIVDELVNSKQGRSLGGFDDVYSDPTIKEALDVGDDTEARNLIKGRLCTLGLIQCEDDDSQEKRTYLSPDQLIYAQPVDIKPIGKPVASIPIRGPPRAYGPPKPMPYRPHPQKVPPKRQGYPGNRPGFSEKYGTASNNFQFSQNSGSYGQDFNYVTKPPSYGNEGPYSFENPKPIYNKIPSTLQSNTKTEAVVQQHVHHHYVHDDSSKDPKVIIKPVAIPVGSVGHLGSQIHNQESTDIITSSGADFSAFNNGGFKLMTSGFVQSKPVYESDTVYGSQFGHNNFNKGSSNIVSQGLPNQYANSAFDDQKYGNSLGSYASQNNEFYKKELHVGSSNNVFNQGPATFGQNNQYQENYHAGKAQGFECVCVNYDQCPSQEIIGRRDDLYLPIDPRNKGSEILAEESENTNSTSGITTTTTSQNVTEAKSVSKREAKSDKNETPAKEIEPRQGYFGHNQIQQCGQNQVCCRRPLRPQASNRGQCGIRHSQGINGRIKTPAYVDGDSEFGEYPWQAAILKKDPKESVYVCGGTLIDGLHIMTAAHCIKSYKGFDLRVRLGEWDVNHDVEFYPYIERDVISVHVHPQYYAGTLDNDLAILKLDHPVEWTKFPHISPACLPDKYTDFSGQRCWTTGWGKDAFGSNGKYQNILKEVDVPVLPHGLCQQQLRQTRLGYNYELNPGFICAGGEEGKDACKGDGGGPLVCERGGTWQLVGVVSWGIGCGQPGVPGVYVKVAHYLDWISQVTGKFSHY